MNEQQDQIDQLKARVLELETAMDVMAKASFIVIKYFAEKNETK